MPSYASVFFMAAPHHVMYAIWLPFVALSRDSAPRCRRKRHWSGHLSLREKKRLLARSLGEEPPDKQKPKESTCQVNNLSEAPPSHNARYAASEKAQAQASSPSPSECGSAEAKLTIGDCWPTSDLTLRWLRQGRVKMEAFQNAMRRCLSSPARPCHWPFPECLVCEEDALACGPSEPPRELPSPLATCSSTSPASATRKEADFEECNGNHSRVHRLMQHVNLMPSEAVESGSNCCSSRAQNCALIISEDPLLRLSLLAMSLGISQVHTVVMNNSTWENAVTIAKCFGRPDSLRIFRSLEALEDEIFGERISKALSGEAVPHHTCRPGLACTHELSERALKPFSASPTTGANNGGRGDILEDTLTADELQAHLHRYRLVLIDDHYCGPIVSAFGLTQLLQFCQTHTCPLCCTLLPRRWQTLMTPASCPPLLSNSRHAAIVEATKGFFSKALQHSWIAASGRAMGCSFVRVEDVSLSDRFCVFESFETTPPKLSSYGSRCLYDDRTSPTSNPFSHQTCAGECTLLQEELKSSESLLKTRCFRCARDRQLSWSDKQRRSRSSGAVCGVEVAGSCAGFIMRNHILVDEGLPLPPSSPLMIFLPEEVPLTTGHMIMLGSGKQLAHLAACAVAPLFLRKSTAVLPAAEPSSPKKRQQLKAVTGICEGGTTNKSSQAMPDSQGNQEGCVASSERGCEGHVNNEAAGGAIRADLLKTVQEEFSGADARAREKMSDSDESTRLAQTDSLIVPWRDLVQQQPTFRWKCATINESLSQSDFSLVLTLRDLHKVTRSHASDQLQHQE
ncbi:hypothetical protein Esti_002199 [Eimeria stiedai]